MKNPNLFIATPMYGGMCTGLFAQSLMQTPSVLGQAGVNMQFTVLMNESLIQRGRNTLAHQFLKSDCSHLMFIDSDIKFRPQDIIPMVQSDKDIICGIYPKKEINWPMVHHAVSQGKTWQDLPNFTGSFVVNLIDNAPSVTVPQNQPFEVAHGGTGFMLIKREVIEGMASKVPHYKNDVSDTGKHGSLGEEIAELFPVFIDPDSKRLLSEDFAFCNMARKMGYRVWAAPWVELSHIGTYVFSGKLVVKE